MYLLSLYSEPAGLFKPIEFKDGVNFIFGKKDVDASSKESLNGIGKSTILEMLDFCLGAEYNKTSSARLYKEFNRVEKFYLILEFEVDNDSTYYIKRGFEKPKNIEIGNASFINYYDLKEGKKELFNLIFRDPNYKGIQRDTWYRSLMSFFLKVHKKRKDEFTDPIQYIPQNKITELNQYHLYLMGIDNSLAVKNFDLQNNARDRDAAIREIRRMIELNHNVNIKDANKKVDRLQSDINRAKGLVDSFKLADQHKNVEDKLNSMTVEIKELSAEKFWNEKKLDSLRESFLIKDSLSSSKVRSISKIYSEVNAILGGYIKRTLDEAIEFRQALASSRQEFLSDEIDNLTTAIEKISQKIDDLDHKRAELFKSLKAKEAFTDLTEAFEYIGRLQRDLVELESKVKTYQDLENAKSKWRLEDSKLTMEVVDFLSTIQNDILMFKNIFNFVYEEIYPANTNSSGFSITQSFDQQSKSKFSINISFEAEQSKGWNKGRTLIYDIAIILNIVEKNLRKPRFLVHDGIFDGMDKAHFVDLYHFVQNQQKDGNRFQYIVTLNEEGTLNQTFGLTDDLTPEKIGSEAISVLTPRSKLWQR